MKEKKDIKITIVHMKELKGADYNPRKWDDAAVDNLKASILKFGVVDPVIVNSAPKRKNVVIGGHFRLHVLKQIGWTAVPVVYVNVPDLAAEKELNLRLNKNAGEWDYALLARLDESILKAGGFTAQDLDKIFRDNAGPDADAAPSLPAKTKVKVGDIYQLGRHRVMCGDATRSEDLARLMGDERSDMVFTDPPYNVDYGASKNPKHKIRSIVGDKQSPEQWKEFCIKLFETFKSYNSGDIYLWGASSPEGMRSRLWLVEMGCHWSATIIWKKDQLVLTPANFQRMYEPCFYGWFDKSSWQGGRKMTEVWEIDRPKDSKLHPTMKPVELCSNGIENSSPREGLVLDLFGGSGSTLIACEHLNRRCNMMELDPCYCQVIIDRWETFTGKKALKVQ